MCPLIDNFDDIRAAHAQIYGTTPSVHPVENTQVPLSPPVSGGYPYPQPGDKPFAHGTAKRFNCIWPHAWLDAKGAPKEHGGCYHNVVWECAKAGKCMYTKD